MFRKHQFGAAAAQNVIHFIERAADEMNTEAAGPDDVVWSATQLLGADLFAIIAQTHSQTIAGVLETKPDQLIVFQFVGIADDIRAGLIHTEHHKRALAFAKRI